MKGGPDLPPWVVAVIVVVVVGVAGFFLYRSTGPRKAAVMDKDTMMKAYQSSMQNTSRARRGPMGGPPPGMMSGGPPPSATGGR